MYFFVDESGHTGQQLFDPQQPTLYYGVLSSRLNVDVLAEDGLNRLRRLLAVPRLHAAELGNARLSGIAPTIESLQRRLDLRFDLYRVVKSDHAVISFFDQVFDQGMNPAVPWHWYWTPLRYPLLIKLAYLFDAELASLAWSARLERNDELANANLVRVCDELRQRLGRLPDLRSQQLLGEGLAWARANPDSIRYNAKSPEEAIVIAPNTIGFQSVILGIASRVSKMRPRSLQVVVDQQSQFNKAQQTTLGWYQKAKASSHAIALGPGMPTMGLAGIPDSPLLFRSSTQSPGLELVDIFLWTFKRLYEQKEVAPELHALARAQVHRGRTDEISLRGLESRWGQWFRELPEPSPEQLGRARELLEEAEVRRANAVAAHVTLDTALPQPAISATHGSGRESEPH